MERNRAAQKRILILIVGVLLISAAVFWILRKLRPEDAGPPRSVTVSTVAPEKQDLAIRIAFPAILESAQTVTVVPKVSGTLLEITAEQGMSVRKGELLARVDPQPYALELKSAEAAWKLAENTLIRIESLNRSSGTSQQQLEEARASRDAALASYELARMRLDYADVISPMDGLVLNRYADSGNIASVSGPLFLIGDSENLRAKVKVPEKYWNRFKNPRNVDVRVSRPDTDDTGTARILLIGPSVSPENKTFEVTCTFNPGSISWPIGCRLRVEFVIDEKKAVWSLPLRTLSGDGGLWRLDPADSTVHRLDDPGLFRDEERIAVPEEWSGSLFVLDGHHRLIEGQIVKAYGGGI